MIQKLDLNTQEKLKSLSDQHMKEREKINDYQERLKTLEADIKEASKTENILRKRLNEGGKITDIIEDERTKKINKYRFKFRVELLNEQDVIKQLDTEIEEFNKLLDLQIKELHPIHQKLITKLTEIIEEYNPDFEVTSFIH